MANLCFRLGHTAFSLLCCAASIMIRSFIGKPRIDRVFIHRKTEDREVERAGGGVRY